jgi:hypothetical protein
VREYDTIQFDTIDERRSAEPKERESAVERLASLVYSLIMAYIWFWILLAALMLVGYVVSRVF